MMGKPSRDKGKRGEREVVERFARDSYIDARRDWESQSKPGGQKYGDIQLTTPKHHGPGNDRLPVYLEVRRRASQLDIPAWIREVEEQAPSGFYRAVVFRRDREDWHVAIPLDEYIDLLERRFP